MNLNDFIVNVFCEIDDFVKNNLPVAAVVLDSVTIPVYRFARVRHSNLIKGISLV